MMRRGRQTAGRNECVDRVRCEAGSSQRDRNAKSRTGEEVVERIAACRSSPVEVRENETRVRIPGGTASRAFLPNETLFCERTYR